MARSFLGRVRRPDLRHAERLVLSKGQRSALTDLAAFLTGRARLALAVAVAVVIVGTVIAARRDVIARGDTEWSGLVLQALLLVGAIAMLAVGGRLRSFYPLAVRLACRLWHSVGSPASQGRRVLSRARDRPPRKDRET